MKPVSTGFAVYARTLSLPTLALIAVHLSLAALVAPDERGPDHAARIIEHNQAVHLAGESDAFDVAARCSGLIENAADRALSGVPPVLGTLFGPQRPLHAHVFVRGSKRVLQMAVLVDEEGARAAGSDVDSHPIVQGVVSRPR